MSVLTEPKIDGHCHVLDPARFPYAKSVAYHPAGQEMGNAEYFLQLMQCYEVVALAEAGA
jgi:predicted TIM-barrel fold metal-dependent hydrolase